MLFSGKQGLTVPDEPSPAESRLGTSTDGHWEHKTLVCFHCASGCCLLGPSRSQDCSQDSVESRGQGEEEPVPLGRGAFWQPQLRRRRPWTSVREGYDAGRDGFIDLMELKLMMEKLGAPQTHLGLKNMINEVDEDFDSKLSFREFLLIFRKAAAGELQEDSGLHVLARLSEIDVSTEGVKGAKNFFEAKVQAINVSSRFEEEIKAEQEERKKQAEEVKQRKAAFKELQSTFK
ncbi:EF-hand domain-containing protein D2 isoform X2 [Mesocricetus auratus]|uniref:EF-hand domain-containing protein D2 isoform X2 n=1 Tax=Mesocricetus auratus TaxID=10036 RepID=A0A3Q0D7S3_MESAU|nr:EF-hand domain-containing protein D2 isoform X2 [Mesocricetus auratus]